MDDTAFFAAFRAGTIEPRDFDHRAHLRAAWCALRHAPFLEACIAVRDGLGHVARKANQPGLYHETLTIAFMALIAERIDGDPSCDAAVFLAAHPELFDRALLARHYQPATLASEVARRRFVLCDPIDQRVAA